VYYWCVVEGDVMCSCYTVDHVAALAASSFLAEIGGRGWRTAEDQIYRLAAIWGLGRVPKFHLIKIRRKDIWSSAPLSYCEKSQGILTNLLRVVVPRSFHFTSAKPVHAAPSLSIAADAPHYSLW
jgi:hypothetical protein